MTFSDNLFNIQCQCGHVADLGLFCRTPVTGDLPCGHYQCPKCNRAWKTVKGKITITARRTLLNEPNRIIQIAPQL